MILMKSLAFGYPRRGLSGEFNTFRLGARAATLQPGTRVDLVDARSKRLIKRATVLETHVGTLTDMARAHAHQAHNWKDHPAEQRAELLIASMKRRYPPGRCRDDSLVSVVYLKESMNTIVTHTYRCADCGDTTDIHVEDGKDFEAPECQHCGSSNTEEEFE